MRPSVGFICTSAWVLLAKAKALTDLSDVQGITGAYVDSCYTGQLLCGTRRWNKLRGLLRGKWTQIPVAGQAVRFGGGAATVQAIYRFWLRVGTWESFVELHVVTGSLCHPSGECGRNATP